MPMPRGNRPSMAAFTSVGERKASEIVMLTCRTLHFSRAASCSTSETLRLEWCGQEGHYETQQRDHGTQLGHGLCRGVMQQHLRCRKAPVPTQNSESQEILEFFGIQSFE